MLRRLAIAALMFVTTATGASAGNDSRLTFETDILPILNAHCLQCHGGVHQKNDLDLRTRQVRRGGCARQTASARPVQEAF